jgi:hypothetical protein
MKFKDYDQLFGEYYSISGQQRPAHGKTFSESKKKLMMNGKLNLLQNQLFI